MVGGMQSLHSLGGSRSRCLLSLTPVCFINGTVCTLIAGVAFTWCADAGDETLRFWNVLPGPKSQSTGSEASVTTMMRTLIR